MSPADPAALAASPANEVVLTTLEDAARPRPPDDPWALAGFELHTHPDLVERFEAVADTGSGASMLALYGVPVIVVGSRIVAVARGTRRIDLRIDPGPVRNEIRRHDGAESPFGEGWIGADAWLSRLPSAEGEAVLRRWVAAAVGSRESGSDA